MALPSGYISIRGLWNRNGFYCDTGIVPSNTLRVRGFFFISGNSQNYVFGGRETNSTSSAKQFGFYANGGSEGTGNSAVCFAGSQASIADGGTIANQIYIENTDNEFTLTSYSRYLSTYTGATTTFTGTKNIYIGAMNGGGTVVYGNGNHRPMIYAFAFEKNGAVLKEFTPAYEQSTGKYGLYDLKNDAFIEALGNSFSDYHLLQTESTEGGTGVIETFNAGPVVKQYVIDKDFMDGTSTTVFSHEAAKTVIKAVPNKGYEFINWTIDGEEFSKEESVEVHLEADMTIKANFRKVTDEDFGCGFKLLGIKYASIKTPTSQSSEKGRVADIYTNIISMNIKDDGLSKSTSTIECESIPSVYQNDMIVFVLSPKGKMVYSGIIKNIEGNTLTVREALSIFETEFIFEKLTADMKKQSVAGVLYSELSRASGGRLSTSTMDADQYCWDITRRKYTRVELSFEGLNFYNAVLNFAPNRTDANISDLEGYTQDIFNEFGVYCRPTLYNYTSDVSFLIDKGVYRQLRFYVGQNTEDTLVLSDNSEFISNVNVVEEEMESTLLVIVNSTYTTFRGAFVMETDGTITNTALYNWDTEKRAIAYNNLKVKIVASDDNAKTIVKQNLSNAQYNHKITFDVDIKNGMYRFEEFQIGRRVNFYYNDKMYTSLITAYEFDVAENQHDITKAKITLGKVRTKLTSKINLGKVRGHA